MNEFPSRDEFFNCLNDKFRIFFSPEQATEVELIEVTEIRKQPRVEDFSLIFSVPKSVPSRQSLYHVEHDALEAMDLFLVPVEETPESYLYEAVFNRKITVSNG